MHLTYLNARVKPGWLQCYVMHVNLTLRSLVRPFLLILQVSDFYKAFKCSKLSKTTSCNWQRSSTDESLTHGVTCSLFLHVKMSASKYFRSLSVLQNLENLSYKIV